MTSTERESFVKEFLDTYCLPVMVSKGSEYSRGEVDVNSNFKRVAFSLDISALQAAFVYAAKHWDSITNYIKNPDAKLSEPIEGRVGDMINYLLIFATLIKEAQGGSGGQ